MPGRTGVLFVHGIGEQRQSESLRWFTRALFDWLEWWFAARPGSGRPEVRASELSYGHDLAGPARVELAIPPDPPGASSESTWVIAEGWWAARIAPPPLADVLQWARRSAGRALTRLGIEAMDRAGLVVARLGGRARRPVAKSDPGWLGSLIELVSTILLSGLYLLGLPLVLALITVLSLITLIPIPQLRQFTFVRLIEPFLVEGLGDFGTYIEDDVQGVHIRERVIEDIDWLVDKAGCEHVVVVAHSHGAVVAFDALTSGRARNIHRVTKLITVGGALNNAFDLHGDVARVRGTLPSHIFWLDVWSYYDPVPGGRLVRRIPGAPPLVAPTEALVREMRWYERSDDVTDVPGALPSAPLPRQVTNGMNVLTDHDGYWRNPEQFLGRLAAEIDMPIGYYQRSRFHFRDLWRRTKRRRLRITTLVGWRLAAMLAFPAALLGRIALYGVDRVAAEGDAIGSWLSRLPGLAIIEMPFWARLWDLLIAAAVIGGALFVLYLLLLWLLFRPWDRREARESPLPTLPPHRPLVLARTLGVLVPLGLLAYLMATVG